MTFKYRIVDTHCAFSALSARGYGKNVFVFALRFQGALDKEAFQQATDETANTYPHLRSVLNVSKIEGRNTLVREPLSPALSLISFPDVSLADRSPVFPDTILQHVTPHIDRDWDLFKEPPFEVQILNMGEDDWVFVALVHSAAGDTTGAVKVGVHIFGNYHRIITGEAPGWFESDTLFSTAKKRKAVPSKLGPWSGLRNLLRQIGTSREKVSLPVGSTNDRSDSREWSARRVLSEAETQSIVKSLGRIQLHFLDHLIAGTNVALDKWNSAHNVSPAVNTTLVPVNMRGRFGGEDEISFSAPLIFRSTPEERADYQEYVRFLSRERRKKFKSQEDLQYHVALSGIGNWLRRLPLGPGTMSRLASFVAYRDTVSAMVVWMGVALTKTVDGRVHKNTSITQVGNLKLTDLYATQYKMAAKMGVLLAAYIFDRKLNLILSSPAKYLSRDECEGFLTLIEQSLRHAASQKRRPQTLA